MEPTLLYLLLVCIINTFLSCLMFRGLGGFLREIWREDFSYFTKIFMLVAYILGVGFFVAGTIVSIYQIYGYL